MELRDALHKLAIGTGGVRHAGMALVLQDIAVCDTLLASG